MYFGIRRNGCKYPLSFHRSFCLITGCPGFTSIVEGGFSAGASVSVELWPNTGVAKEDATRNVPNAFMCALEMTGIFPYLSCLEANDGPKPARNATPFWHASC